MFRMSVEDARIVDSVGINSGNECLEDLEYQIDVFLYQQKGHRLWQTFPLAYWEAVRGQSSTLASSVK